MIRKLQRADISKVAEIWLETNLKTHYFIFGKNEQRTETED